MPHHDYVVLDPSVSVYLTDYTTQGETIVSCTWGNSVGAIIFPSLEDANKMAQKIGGGTVGTTKPS